MFLQHHIIPASRLYHGERGCVSGMKFKCIAAGCRTFGVHRVPSAFCQVSKDLWKVPGKCVAVPDKSNPEGICSKKGLQEQESGAGQYSHHTKVTQHVEPLAAVNILSLGKLLPAMNRLIECVPNFSEGRDKHTIDRITAAICEVEGIRLLDVDMGASTNRTVVTFVGAPEQVVEAAFRGIRVAAELIDMRKHSGAHPRMGATDVCPIIPISGVSIDECVEYSRILAARVGAELGIPVYLYEYAATADYRRNLADIREGEYEGFADKISLPNWKPDFGPGVLPPRHGATVIGVRDFLIAYNVNLNTTSVRRANAVAFDVREKGRVKTEDGTPNGKPVLGPDGEPVRIPGMLKHTKAIGWYVAEYGIAQVSINLTNHRETPLHEVFEACCTSAHQRGMRVTGSEIVGLLPKDCMIEAGKYFLRKQNRSAGVSERELIHTAIVSMGLNEVSVFDPEKKIIEYSIRNASHNRLVTLSVAGFSEELASESPAPGGGSVAALCGALGVSLGTMVANLSATKRGWESRFAEFDRWANLGQGYREKLLALVDEDTLAFNKVMDAFGMPKNTEEEKQIRRMAIEKANTEAARVPLKVMLAACEAFPLCEEMAANGNPNSITDAGVGALCLYTAVHGAYMNVLINLGGIQDEGIRNAMRAEADMLLSQAAAYRDTVVSAVQAKL